MSSSELPADAASSLPVEMIGGGCLNASCNPKYYTEPCSHIPSWKRIRSKKGFNHFSCELCGLRWRTLTMKKRVQLFIANDIHHLLLNNNNSEKEKMNTKRRINTAG
jgi:hypothetical protein